MSQPSPKRWTALWFIALAQFMVIMDTSIIAVALPEIQADLGFSQANLTWLFNGFLVAFGGLLLLGGRLADLFGAKRMFSLGWAVLLGGSVLAAVAGSPGLLVAGRAVQGVGSALIAPAALTLLMVLFSHDPKELTKAIAIFGAAAPAGGTAGVFLGGVIAEWLSWPWVFWLYVPIALAALAAIPALMPTALARRGRVDVVGAAAVTAGLALVVLGVVRAPEEGWGSFTTLSVLAAGVALLGVFVLVQRVVKVPLVRLSIFRTLNLAGANVAQMLLGAAWVPMWYFLNLYLQQVLGYGAFASGAALLPMTVFIMVGMVGLAPRLIARFGPRRLIVAGPVVLGAGLVLLSLVRPDGNFAVDVLGASLLAAGGQVLAFIPSLGMAISSARPEEGGLAAGIVNTSYQVGSAVGLAAMTALAVSQGAGQIGNPELLTEGFSAGFLGAAGIALAGALLAVVTIRQPRRTDSAPARGSDTSLGAPAPSSR
ncbi:MAG TPA: MFS transporter [Acidimicrobiales bacterium]|nr:MFS transporter [Acidimicrobiales bacterium]